MTFPKSSVPASVRKQIETIRTTTQHEKAQTPGLSMLATKLRSGAKSAPKAESVHLKTLFLNDPQEPEDAKLTGDTRSLNRRLLGLNLRGSLGQRVPGLAGS